MVAVVTAPLLVVVSGDALRGPGAEVAPGAPKGFTPSTGSGPGSLCPRRPGGGGVRGSRMRDRKPPSLPWGLRIPPGRLPHGPGDPDGALSPPFILCTGLVLRTAWYCGTACTSNCVVVPTTRYCCGGPCGPPGPAASPVARPANHLAWNPTAGLPARAPAVWAPSPGYRVLRLLVLPNSTSHCWYCAYRTAVLLGGDP